MIAARQSVEQRTCIGGVAFLPAVSEQALPSGIKPGWCTVTQGRGEGVPFISPRILFASY
jgi:hypothetical protein